MLCASITMTFLIVLHPKHTMISHTPVLYMHELATRYHLVPDFSFILDYQSRVVIVFDQEWSIIFGPVNTVMDCMNYTVNIILHTHARPHSSSSQWPCFIQKRSLNATAPRHSALRRTVSCECPNIWDSSCLDRMNIHLGRQFISERINTDGSCSSPFLKRLILQLGSERVRLGAMVPSAAQCKWCQ